MDKPMKSLTEVQHKELGITLFNRVWELMDKPERTPEEDDEMLHAAHASRYHWGASHPPAVNLARGEWQVSRVYCVLKRAEPALFHAQRSLDICLQNNIGDFDLAYGHEAMARAYQLAGDSIKTSQFLAEANEVAEKINDPEDKKILLQDLETIGRERTFRADH